MPDRDKIAVIIHALNTLAQPVHLAKFSLPHPSAGKNTVGRFTLIQITKRFDLLADRCIWQDFQQAHLNVVRFHRKNLSKGRQKCVWRIVGKAKDEIHMQIDVVQASQPFDNSSNLCCFNSSLYRMKRLFMQRLNTNLKLKFANRRFGENRKHLLTESFWSNFKMKTGGAVIVQQHLPNCQSPARIVVEGAVNKSQFFWIMAQDLGQFQPNSIKLLMDHPTIICRQAIGAGIRTAARAFIVHKAVFEMAEKILADIRKRKNFTGSAG